MNTQRARLALLAAIAATGVGATVAVATSDAPSNSAEIKRQIDAPKPKNVILLVGDGMGDSEVTLGRYYGKGAAGRLNMDRLAFRGDSIHYVLRPGPGRRTSPTTSATPRRPPPRGRPASARRTAASRRARPRPTTSRPEHGLHDLHGARQDARQGDRQRLDRGDHRRDAGRAELAHLPARLPGPGRHAHDLPDGGQDGGRPASARSPSSRSTNGFDLYLGGGRARYEQPLTAGGTTNVIDYAQTKGYTYVDTKAGLAGITRCGARRSSACSTRAT